MALDLTSSIDPFSTHVECRIRLTLEQLPRRLLETLRTQVPRTFRVEEGECLPKGLKVRPLIRLKDHELPLIVAVPWVCKPCQVVKARPVAARAVAARLSQHVDGLNRCSRYTLGTGAAEWPPL